MKDFPYHDIVANVIVRERCANDLSRWENYEWGSHWYNGLGAILKNVSTAGEADLMLSALLDISRFDDSYLESVFMESRSGDPIKAIGMLRKWSMDKHGRQKR